MNQESQTIAELQEAKESYTGHIILIGGTILFLIGLSILASIDYKKIIRLLDQSTA